jgi:drug/metabolite transporter (DMT)-like permease
MPAPQIVSAGFSLAAVVCWGTSDFSGGYAAKRIDAFLVTLLAHSGGFTLMVVLARSTHAAVPSQSSVFWALLAGALGGAALAVFYRALALGNMGLTAPVAAVVTAAIPTAYGMTMEGIPRSTALIGFGLAGLGIWLISRPEGGFGHTQGLTLALLAGVGFASFMICIHKAGNASVLWSTAYSRLGSLLVLAVIVLVRPPRCFDARALGPAIVAGLMDATGTALFVRADQTGRFDAAVVLSSLYPVVTVLLARIFLKERFTRWKTIGMLAALAAVPMIAWQ